MQCERATRDAPDGRTAGARARTISADPAGCRQVLSTEHWSLLSTRSLAYGESFSRVEIFLALLTGSIIGLALLAQVDRYHEVFTVAAFLLLSVVLFAGLATIARLTALNREDLRCVVGMNRMRRAYLDLHPELEPYFLAASHDDLPGVLLTLDMDMVPGRWRVRDAAHALETLPAMLGVNVAVVAGVLAALVAGWLGAAMPVVVAVASAVFLATVVLLAVFIRKDFDDFAAAMPTRFPSVGPLPDGGCGRERVEEE